MKTTTKLIAALALGVAACTSAYGSPATAWFTTVGPMFDTVVEPMFDVSRTCGVLDVAGCKRATLVAASKSAEVLRMLNNSPAPACLSKVERQVKQAFGLLKSGNELMAYQITTMTVDGRPADQIAEGNAIIQSLTQNLPQLAASCQL
jgi:hypothetical protein